MSDPVAPLPRGRRTSCWLVVVTIFGVLPSARADVARTPQVIVLGEVRGTGVPPNVVSDIDRVLLATLAEDAGLSGSYLSEVALEDVKLLSGCATPLTDCLERLAIALGGERLLLREVDAHGPAEFELTLSAQDERHPGRTRHVQASLARAEPSSRAQIVRSLIRTLYLPSGATGDETLKVPSPAQASERTSTLAVLGISSGALSGALLVSGFTLGILSRRDQDAYRNLDTRTVDDVARAEALLERSRTRATAANRCFAGGALFVLIGVGLWVFDRNFFVKQSQSKLSFSVTPKSSGAVLTLSKSIAGRFE